ncbi:MAG: hypothetical protein JJE36_03245 [Coriobacteriia bacterium]|nr:hypothetical protein [Coriobacteriia bacterium]
MKARKYADLLVAFAVSGLWHGVGLTYLARGLLNGFYQIVGQLLAPFNRRVGCSFARRQSGGTFNASNFVYNQF